MPNYYEGSYSTITLTFRDLYFRFINFLPNFLGAIIVLVIGLVVAVFIARIIKQLLQSLKLDEIGDKLGLDEVSNRTGIKMSVSGTVAWLVKWFVLLGAFLIAANFLGLSKVSDFLNRILLYIPDVIAAAAILLVGSMIAQFLSGLVRHSVRAAGLASADLLAAVTQWSVMVFTVLAALQQLQIADKFVQTLYTGFIAMLAIAGGLAFGLGGRDHASRVLDKIEKDIKS